MQDPHPTPRRDKLAMRTQAHMVAPICFNVKDAVTNGPSQASPKLQLLQVLTPRPAATHHKPPAQQLSLRWQKGSRGISNFWGEQSGFPALRQSHGQMVPTGAEPRWTGS